VLLLFLNNWSYFSQGPEKSFEKLTTTGPYAGTLQAFGTGVKFRTRYQHLWNDSTQYPPPTVFWTAGSSRVVDTAKYFGAGFFSLGYEKAERATLEVIPEIEDRGGNTLTPGKSCTNYRKDSMNGHNLGERMMNEFRSTYVPSIAQRLEKDNPGFAFTDVEVYSMQEMCGFETLLKGNSEWCNVFTHDDWLNFEYARDIVHYYRSGPGNKYGMAMGWLWLNATANLVQKGPESGTIFFSFGHDGDVIPMLSSLGLFDGDPKLPVDRVLTKRNWKTSQIVPMGGRVTFERMTCTSHPEKHGSQDGVFIRFNVNDGIVALPSCATGPGQSCPLDRFMEHVEERGRLGGDFREICGLPRSTPDRLTFLKQPKRV